MRLLLLLISILIVGLLLAKYLTVFYAPGKNSPISTYDSAQQQLGKIQQQVDRYQQQLK